MNLLRVPLGTLVLAAKDDEPPAWIHLVPIGRWKGHHAVPDFEVTHDTVRQLVANFKLDQSRDHAKPIPLDFEHQTERAATNGHEAPATGWIVDVEARRDGLWGRMEWMEPGASLVRSRRYRFVSPVIYWEARDRVSGLPIGPRLASVALTNTPFFAGFLTPLVATETKLGVSMNLLLTLATLLGLGETATNEQVVEEVTKLKNAGPPAMDAKTVQAAEFGEQILVGLQWAGVPHNGVKRVLKAMKETPAAQLADLQASEASLKQQLAASQAQVILLQAGDGAAQVDALIARGKAEGRITPALEPQVRALAVLSFAEAEKLVGNLPSALTRQGKESEPKTSADAARSALVATLTADEKAGCDNRGIDHAAFALQKNRLAKRGGNQ